jgi:hypothetical protein
MTARFFALVLALVVAALLLAGVVILGLEALGWWAVAVLPRGGWA